MFTTIMLGLLAYSIFLMVFLVGWQRHCIRMEQYDEAVEKAFNTRKESDV